MLTSAASGGASGRIGPALIGLLLVFGFAPLAWPGQLERYEPARKDVQEEERAYAYDAGMLAEDEARRVAEHFFQIFGDREFPFIYRIPDRDRLFLVSALRDHRGEGDFGRRFFLLEEADGSLQRTFRGRGAGDSYSLDPTFYRGDGRVLILAEMGAEYSWGLWAYDLTGSTLRDLGPLDVAFWSGENHVNPLDHARVLFERGGYLVEFRVNLDLGPGGLHPWNLIRTGDAITFEQQEERFVLSGDSIGGQVCFFYLGEAGTQDAAEVLSDIRHFYRQLVPWLERNRLSHSFQENAPLRMVTVGGRETTLDRPNLGSDLGTILMTKEGRMKILPGVSTDVDLILEIRPFFGIGE
jgi:hypothetical protein